MASNIPHFTGFFHESDCDRFVDFAVARSTARRYQRRDGSSPNQVGPVYLGDGDLIQWNMTYRTA
jgi:hypothetical protein